MGFKLIYSRYGAVDYFELNTEEDTIRMAGNDTDEYFAIAVIDSDRKVLWKSEMLHDDNVQKDINKALAQ